MFLQRSCGVVVLNPEVCQLFIRISSLLLQKVELKKIDFFFFAYLVLSNGPVLLCKRFSEKDLL